MAASHVRAEFPITVNQSGKFAALLSFCPELDEAGRKKLTDMAGGTVKGRKSHQASYLSMKTARQRPHFRVARNGLCLL